MTLKGFDLVSQVCICFYLSKSLMIDSIYYTSNLIPIPIEIIERTALVAIVRTLANRLFEVPAHRIIPLANRVLSSNRNRPSNSPKPTGYLSVTEYLRQNDVELSRRACGWLAQAAGYACRSQGMVSFIGKNSVRYFPASVLDECYRRMPANPKINDEKNS
jgi:hypothetical protein